MDKLVRVGLLLYGTAILLLGIEHLITGNFPVALLPIPAAMPARLLLVYGTGAVLVAAGIGLISQKKAGLAALVVGIGFILLGLLVHVPPLMANPKNGGVWTVLFELMALGGGGLLIAGRFPADFPGVRQSRITRRLGLYGNGLFALSLVIFGIQHLIYGPFVATLIPPWIPGHLFWAYFVGFAFLATAASILLHKQLPLAATLLGTMFLLWVVLLHAPRVMANPNREAEWTSAIIALAMGGISFCLAGPYSRLNNRPAAQPSSVSIT